MRQAERRGAAAAVRAGDAGAIRRAGIILLSSLILLAAYALPGKAATDEQVNDFLKVTGFDVALESIQLSAEAGPQMLNLQQSDFATTWKVLTDDIFAPATLKSMGEKMIQAKISDEELAFASDFYSGDLGKRLVEAENASHMDTDQDRSAKSQDVLAKLIDDGKTDRVALLDRLNAAVDAADDSEISMADVQFRFLTAARDAGIIDFQVDDQTLHDSLKENAKANKDQNRMNALINSAYTYRDFTDAELETYAKALEDPKMQAVYKLMNDVQYEVMAERFEAAAAKLKGVEPSTDL
ncbi:hypothetical protein KM176_05295 [Pseudooceanicola sp. CBS1P-1]|uniref:DUF2059 domain-containing protein n=1 Tax=Pseudooceanicola albus TaxID=2692189 RepID=A0A6L7FYN0_9RHOB|nr:MULTISPECIES: DUF2059 domain-containing protein [Pseudooceanicola]MBT9383267.1 hypothetical protein [Pseudooceanicola endophyticus]MXN16410.1 hypothetical protein [Pseudooceanicola albus]